MNANPGDRSAIMRAVKGRDTKPELLVRRTVHAMGYRFRLHRRDLPGNPDLVFPGRGKVIFVNGCFWHGHDCSRGARTPKTNAEYWERKIGRNRNRDVRVTKKLIEMGWAVLTIWECEIREPARTAKQLRRFLDKVKPRGKQ